MPLIRWNLPSEGPSETAHLRRLAWLFDSTVRLPFGLTVGLDALIGLLPGLGDVAGAVVASIGLFTAWQLGAPAAVQLRMLYNILVDTLVGEIPILGDLFDIVWESQVKNVTLLEAWLARPDHVARRSCWLLVGVLSAAILTFVATAALGIWLLYWLVGLLGR